MLQRTDPGAFVLGGRVPILDVWVVCKVFPFWKFARLGPFRERFPIIGLKKPN